MDRQDQELLDTQMRRLSAPRNDGAIAVLLAVMFLVGMTLGGVLSQGIQGSAGLWKTWTTRNFTAV